jgi:hypothetical protein
VASFWNLEAVKVCGDIVINIFAELLDRLFLLLIPRITQALEEKQRKDKVSQIGRIYWPTQDIGRFPEPGLNVLLGGSRHGSTLLWLDDILGP